MEEGPSLTRLALGALVLAAERLGVGDRARTGLATATGVTGEAVAGARDVAGAARARAARIAVTGATTTARALPPAFTDPLVRGRAAVRARIARARRKGGATLDAGRAEALALVRSSVDDGVAWAQVNVVPRVVDGLVPHLVDYVVPRIIDGVMPRIRYRVLPVVIEDLTADPRVRELVVEQGRGVIGDTAEQVRTGTAEADDRLETAFRRVFGGGGRT